MNRRTLLQMVVTLCVISLLGCSVVHAGENIRIATYNIEHFMNKFDQFQMPERSRDRTEQFRDEEDLFEIAFTIKAMDPDILVIQECCDQKNLEFFNTRWLSGKYAYVKIFRGNTEGQWLAALTKPGFSVEQVREFYDYRDPFKDSKAQRSNEDTTAAAENLLFSRGPAFILVQTPGGQKIWVGCTHVKSKYGNSTSVTQWRIREIEETRKICGRLLASRQTPYLILLGDFNDDLGTDSYEDRAGKDALVQMLEGPEKLVSPTIELARKNPALATYHCLIKPPKYRSFIDHIFLSPALEPMCKNTVVFDESIAYPASDHLPVFVNIELPQVAVK